MERLSRSLNITVVFFKYSDTIKEHLMNVESRQSKEMKKGIYSLSNTMHDM